MSKNNLNLSILDINPNLINDQEFKQLLQNPLFKKDSWHTINDLSLEIPEHRNILTFNFSHIQQDWLKILGKLRVLKMCKSGFKPSTVRFTLNFLYKFSNFLTEKSIDLPDLIQESIFEDFNHWLKINGATDNIIASANRNLSAFFDSCRIEGWININTYWFKNKCSVKRLRSPININYIPEEVWNQLDQNLHYLPEILQRMVLIIRVTGIRGGELLNLPLDCLRKRGDQWRLRFKTEKYDTEDELPICQELVAIIKEQQIYIKDNFGNKYNKLFCANTAPGNLKDRKFVPIPKVMKLASFNRWLNKLAEACNICSKDGKLWHFQSHQFRRTVGTIFTNAGVRDLIIQKYLRHRSPDMQNYYKHLLTQVLKDEYEELMREKKYVDIAGKVIASYKPQNPITEALRKKMYQITTQYGECHRPIIQNPCQTVNSCWNCEHWRVSSEDLSYLKTDLTRIQEELIIADKLGMTRQKQGLEGDYNRLITCIKGLEEIND